MKDCIFNFPSANNAAPGDYNCLAVQPSGDLIGIIHCTKSRGKRRFFIYTYSVINIDKSMLNVKSLVTLLCLIGQVLHQLTWPMHKFY